MPKLDRIQHPSHPAHPLHHKPIETLYKCDGCKQLGFEMCYRCKRCDFQLHKHCARACDTIYHPFFPKHTLVFRDHPPNHIRSCEACGDSVLGFRYKAWRWNAYGWPNPFLRLLQHLTQKALHPSCASLPPTLTAMGDNSTRLELRLDKLKSKRQRPWCDICSNEGYSRGVKGWAYVSSCGRFIFHVACVKQRMEEDWENRSLKKWQQKKKMVLTTGLTAARVALELIIDAILGFPIKSVGKLAESLLGEKEP
ncbi:hypothetical protein SAY87_001099 [Trapa incisa]|uniref:DC1 domain-containing protein n=1 Tax=Trapa incisa TaxID=236973 RepID=A0AAN7GFN1_9MYRT|nr:hypothetical protein SAY87_001099 [Trapa incisa]